MRTLFFALGLSFTEACVVSSPAASMAVYSRFKRRMPRSK